MKNDFEGESHHLEQVFPHYLRAKALTEKLPPEHIGRAIYHLGQRRGYLSNRKTDNKNDNKGKVAGAINSLKEAMRYAQVKTLGDFLSTVLIQLKKE